MNNKQNKFYASISKYYAEIFPYKPIQLQFIKQSMDSLKGKQILDIGCATGELAYQLAMEGAVVMGIDLNTDLLEQAKSKKQIENLRFQKGDMLKLTNDFEKNKFDAVICFGNTLVHLLDKTAIRKMLRGVEHILMPGGKFLLQILNYNYILNENISELPLIESEKLTFIRKYKFNQSRNRAQFQTDLCLKKTGEVISNETELFTLKREELHSMLKETGFKMIRDYANFNMAISGGKHLPLVIYAEK